MLAALNSELARANRACESVNALSSCSAAVAASLVRSSANSRAAAAFIPASSERFANSEPTPPKTCSASATASLSCPPRSDTPLSIAAHSATIRTRASNNRPYSCSTKPNDSTRASSVAAARAVCTAVSATYVRSNAEVAATSRASDSAAIPVIRSVGDAARSC